MKARFVHASGGNAAAVMLAGLLSASWVSAADAQASPWLPFAGGDVAYNELTDNGQMLQGAAETRIGNRTDSGAWELGIWRSIPSGPFLSIGQLPRVNAQVLDFTLTYDGDRSLSWRVGSRAVTTTQLGGRFSDIFIRVQSAANGSIGLSSLQLNGTGPTAQLTAVGAGAVNYLRLSNGALPFGPFEIRGFETLSWVANDPPVNSVVNAQFRFTNIIPGPGTAAVWALIGAGMLRRRRRPFESVGPGLHQAIKPFGPMLPA